MDSVRKIFAYNLRELRAKRTQTQVADAIGVGLREYQRMEGGAKLQLLKFVKKVAFSKHSIYPPW